MRTSRRKNYTMVPFKILVVFLSLGVSQPHLDMERAPCRAAAAAGGGHGWYEWNKVEYQGTF